MSTAEEKRRTVLRKIGDVYGDRIYTSSATTRSVRAEVAWLQRQNFIEEEQREDGLGWRRTAAGDSFLGAA